MEDRNVFEVLWPRGVRQVAQGSLARRPRNLAGKKIALLWDYLFNGDVVFEEIMEGLRSRFKDVQFVHWSVFGNTHGQDERRIVAQLGGTLRALGVDGALSGMGC